MNVLILHDTLSSKARADELDALTQARVISDSLLSLGHRSSTASFSWNLDESARAITRCRPDVAVNLVESVHGSGRWVYLAPALLEELKLPFTGSSTEAMFLTANKIVTKRMLRAHGIDTPRWYSLDAEGAVEKRRSDEPLTRPCVKDRATERHRGFYPQSANSAEPASATGPVAGAPGSDWRNPQSAIVPGRFIMKSVWEEASVGLDEDSVIWADEALTLREAVQQRLGQLGGDGFAEEYIDGREFNLSLLVDEDGVEVLPPAEIDFVDYAAGKPKVVGYRAKWDAESFEYHHTPRRFDFPASDAGLLRELTRMAQECWQVLGLRGYARVDFRVDGDGKPWVLEVNANPCLSPDAGFFAAAQRAGLTFEQVIERIIADALRSAPVAFDNRLAVI